MRFVHPRLFHAWAHPILLSGADNMMFASAVFLGKDIQSSAPLSFRRSRCNGFSMMLAWARRNVVTGFFGHVYL